MCARPLHSTEPVRQSSQPYRSPPPRVLRVSTSGLPRWAKANGSVAITTAIGPATRSSANSRKPRKKNSAGMTSRAVVMTTSGAAAACGA